MSHQESPPYCPLQRVPPELWREIAENLTLEHNITPIHDWKLGTIFPFLRTCREFHELATPVLYRHIRWRSSSDEIQKTLEQVLAKNPYLYKVVRSMSIIGDTKAWNTFYKGDGKVENAPPLGLLTGLRRVHLQDVNITSELCSAIVSLPGLQELSLLRCTFSIDRKPEYAAPVQCSTSLDTLKLDWIQQERAQLQIFIIVFPNLKNLRLTAFRTQTGHMLNAVKSQKLASTLTSLKVIIRSSEVAATFTQFLNVASNIEVIDISYSEVTKIFVASDAIPYLHTYRGPPRLASSFIKGRSVHTVAFIPILEELYLQGRHMAGLQLSSTPIMNVSIYPPSSRDEEYIRLVKRYAGNDCACVVIRPGIQDVELLEATIISPLPP